MNRCAGIGDEDQGFSVGLDGREGWSTSHTEDHRERTKKGEEEGEGKILLLGDEAAGRSKTRRTVEAAER